MIIAVAAILLAGVAGAALGRYVLVKKIRRGTPENADDLGSGEIALAGAGLLTVPGYMALLLHVTPALGGRIDMAAVEASGLLPLLGPVGWALAGFSLLYAGIVAGWLLTKQRTVGTPASN